MLERGKPFAICEWDFPAPQKRVNAIRTRTHRLVFYSRELGGELYDHQTDPYEMRNLWNDPASRDVRLELLELLFDQVKRYACKTDFDSDIVKSREDALTPTHLIHKRCRKWSEFERFFSR